MSPSPKPAGSRPRVLVVDDEAALVRVLQLHLEEEGYEVFTAFHGAEALARIRQSQPDVVVLDVMMPGISGLEVCRRVQEDPQLASTNVIILTANDRFRPACEEAGADGFMTKPFSLATLSREIRRLQEARDSPTV